MRVDARGRPGRRATRCLNLFEIVDSDVCHPNPLPTELEQHLL